MNSNMNQRELYNLEEDRGEKDNRIKKPELKSKVDELMKALSEVVSNGRTTKGPNLENDGSRHWKQLYWMDK